MRTQRKQTRTAAKVDLSAALAQSVIAGMIEKKGKEIVSLNFKDLKNTFCDYFIICHADSRTHVESIAKSIEEEVYKLTGEEPWHKEGFENAEWILLDYINVVAHVFLHEARGFYGIEKLWADADIEKIKGDS